MAEAAKALGGLDIFVANVSALAQSMDEESWRRSLEIDVMGTVAGVEAAIPLLEAIRRRRDRRRRHAPGAVEIAGAPRPYASVKAALAPYVKALARNLAAKNIRANMVSPGNVYFKGGVWNVLEESNPALFQTMLSRNPMGRMGTPEEVANAVVFLASPRASFITGTNLIVDGALDPAGAILRSQRERTGRTGACFERGKIGALAGAGLRQLVERSWPWLVCWKGSACSISAATSPGRSARRCSAIWAPR